MYFNRIPQPAIAINAFDKDEKPNSKGEYDYSVPDCRYKMKLGGDDINQKQDLRNVLGNVKAIAEANGGKIKALVINCHGSPGSLWIGNDRITIYNVNLFSIIQDKFDEIYITACGVAWGFTGTTFCKQLSRLTNAIIHASMQDQEGEPINVFRKKLRNKIDPFEGPVYTHYPDGCIEKSIKYSGEYVESQANYSEMPLIVSGKL